jgi:hypothetical protein
MRPIGPSGIRNMQAMHGARNPSEKVRGALEQVWERK